MQRNRKIIVATVSAAIVFGVMTGCTSTSPTNGNSSKTNSQTVQTQNSNQAQTQQASKAFLFSNEDIGGISVAADKIIADFIVKDNDSGFMWYVSSDGTIISNPEGGIDESAMDNVAVVTTTDKIDETSARNPDGTYRTEIKNSSGGRYEYTLKPLSPGESAIEFSYKQAETDTDSDANFTLFVTVDEYNDIVDAKIEGADFKSSVATAPASPTA